MDNFLELSMSLTLLRLLHSIALETKRFAIFFIDWKNMYSVLIISCTEVNIVEEIMADFLGCFIRHSGDFQSSPLSTSTIQAGKIILWHSSGSNIWSNYLKVPRLDNRERTVFQNLVLGKLDIYIKKNEVSQGKHLGILIKNGETVFLYLCLWA